MSSEIPRTLQILWGGPRRTPARGLSRERIVEAAIALADADGLAALSMARLAERLGSAPMSLYRHVSNKDELLVFMQDAAPGPPPELPAGGEWRAGLEAWAAALREVYYAHPWMLQVAGARPPLEPGRLAWLDRGLAALGGTSFGQRERMGIIMTILYFVRGEAQVGITLARAGSAEGAGGAGGDYAALMAHFVRPENLPSLAEAVVDGVFEASGTDDDTFVTGLARILDGVNVLLTR